MVLGLYRIRYSYFITKSAKKSAICLVLEFIQNSVFLFYHESEHALMMTHGVMGDESSDDDIMTLDLAVCVASPITCERRGAHPASANRS